ncbi:hypothetical protein [Chitinimonas lacunae]|uniref:Lysidine-tRNA(Ile) synthetase C-terminal domain-containing protein n=1 Tax=Chitinimonas lacunae TaxID=1963018 RepID=A0ABV8MUJ0_9NEIS
MAPQHWWIDVRDREADNPSPRGLRAATSPMAYARASPELRAGRYLVTLWDHRLLLIDAVRDKPGDRGGVVLDLTELAGEPAIFLPNAGGEIVTRVHLREAAPDNTPMAKRQWRAELPVFEVSRPQPGEQLVMRGRAWKILKLADDGDDGVIRSAWVAPA